MKTCNMEDTVILAPNYYVQDFTYTSLIILGHIFKFRDI